VSCCGQINDVIPSFARRVAFLLILLSVAPEQRRQSFFHSIAISAPVNRRTPYRRSLCRRHLKIQRVRCNPFPTRPSSWHIIGSPRFELALWNGEVSNVEDMLSESQAEPSHAFPDGTPSICVAVLRGIYKMVVLLAKSGGNVTATVTGGFTSMHLAAKADFKDIAEFLYMSVRNC
jgi:hypothetical protein